MKAYLKLTRDAGQVQEFPIEGSLEIGRASRGWELVMRAEGNETPLGIEDALASRHHASLYLEQDKLMIRDLGSVNGTMVNNRPLPKWVKRKGSEPFPLRDGSIIKIGNSEMEIRLDLTPSYDELVKLAKEAGLDTELSGSYPAKQAQRLASSFRVILDISDKYSNMRTRVKEIASKLETLKEYLAGDQMAAEVDDMQRRMKAQLFEDEFLRESQVWEIKDFCQRFVEHWSSRFMK